MQSVAMQSVSWPMSRESISGSPDEPFLDEWTDVDVDAALSESDTGTDTFVDIVTVPGEDCFVFDTDADADLTLPSIDDAFDIGNAFAITDADITDADIEDLFDYLTRIE